jgi:hypothetical protein
VYVLPHAWRRRHVELLFVASAAWAYLATSTMMLLIGRVDIAGNLVTGLEWGSRYMLAAYPIFAMLTLIALKIYRESDRPLLLKQLVIGIVVILLMLGVHYQLRGLWMLYNNKQTIAQWQGELETRAQEPVVTDLWWLPASLATYFTTHELYAVLQPQDVSDWLPLAAAHQTKAFTFVSTSPLHLEQICSATIRVDQENSHNVAGLYFTHLWLDPTVSHLVLPAAAQSDQASHSK